MKWSGEAAAGWLRGLFYGLGIATASRDYEDSYYFMI